MNRNIRAVGGFFHRPVMLREVIAALQPKSGGRYVDGTLGGGGHTAAILEASSPQGWVYGCDRDGKAMEAARARLAEYSGRWEIRQCNYSELAEWVPSGSCDGFLLDLGVSSPQLDDPGRGFSFMQDGPLDMRMNQGQGMSAAEWVNRTAVEEMARVFYEYGDQPGAWSVARAIERDRAIRPFVTTGQLAGLMERICPRRGRKSHPATNVFLALRMVVNDELGALKRGLEVGLNLLKSGGRMAVITFHSVEDRLVKDFGRNSERDYICPGEVDVPELRQQRTPLLRRVERKALLPSEEEIRTNARSRSAQLRIFEKV